MSSDSNWMKHSIDHGEGESHNTMGDEDRSDEELVDTVVSPSKPRTKLRGATYIGSLSERIRKQRDEEEKARKARDEVFDAGLIGPG